MARRVVLVTGANGGVGMGITKAIASVSPDFHVVMAGRSLDKLEVARSEIEAHFPATKGRLSLQLLDVLKEKSIKKAVEDITRNHGQLDVLINNAGIANVDPDVGTRFRASLETNVLGPAMVSDAFRPLLLQYPNPYSIYISTGQGSLQRVADRLKRGEKSYPNIDAYSTSKAALNMIAVMEHVDFAPKGLKVFVVCPGWIISDLRGTSEEMRTMGGMCRDGIVAGKFILSIVQGEKDAQAGQFHHEDGIYPW